jgi:hypothetical protein
VTWCLKLIGLGRLRAFGSLYVTGDLLILHPSGWKAPRNSTKLVYPDGLINDASDDEANVFFHPTPNYAALAMAATGADGSREYEAKDAMPWMKGVRARTVEELRNALHCATLRVGLGG